MNKTGIAGAALLLVLMAGAAQAQLGGTSTTEDEQNMTAREAAHGTTTVFQEQLKTAYADFSAERYPKATQELQAILKKDPGNLQAHEMMAAVYQKENQVADMVPELETIVKLDPKDKNSQHNLGVAYLQIRSFDKAAATFKTLQASSPKDPKIAYYLGMALLQAGKLEEAVPALQNAVKLQPTAPEYLELGSALAQQGKQDEAAAAFQSAADLDPKDPQAALYTGMLYHQTGHDDKAIPALKKALDLGTDSKFGVHMMLAEAYDKAGKNDDALQEYTLASDAKPDDFSAAAEIGILDQTENKKAEAEAAYRKALTLKAATPEAQAQVQADLAFLLAQDNNTDEALSLLTQATQGDPKNAQYESDLGEVYEKQGKKDLALTAYQKALTLDATQPEAKVGVARLNPKKAP